MNKPVCFFRIVEIGLVPGFPTVEVIIGVIACRMPFLCQRPVHLGVFFHVLPDTEKGGFGIEFPELLQHPGSYIRMGSVIKGQVQYVFLFRPMPG